MLTRQQVVYGLERVELRSTDLFLECPFKFTGPEGRQRPDFDPQCRGLDLLYRTADGTCLCGSQSRSQSRTGLPGCVW